MINPFPRPVKPSLPSRHGRVALSAVFSVLFLLMSVAGPASAGIPGPAPGKNDVQPKANVLCTDMKATSMILGNVVVPPNKRYCLTNVLVTGSITVLSNATITLRNASVSGNITSTAATAVTICTSLIKGDVFIASSTSFVLIGDGGDSKPPGYCPPNLIYGHVGLVSNIGGVELGGNKINNHVRVFSNIAPPGGVENSATEIEANTMLGISCYLNVPPPINDSLVNTAPTKLGQCVGL